MRRLTFRVRRLDRVQRSVVALVAVTLIAAAVGGYAWYGHQQTQQRDAAAHACVAAATPAAQAIFSYDYRTFDASVANARPFIAGDFASEYAKTTASLKPTAVSVKAVVQAQVSAVGLVDTMGDGKIDVMVYLNQYRRNANISGEKVDQDRVVLTMIRSGDGCKVDNATAI
jgi:Mce-associated membrane protein